MALDVHINIKAFLLESHDFEAMAHLFDLYNGLVDPIGAVKFAIYVTQTLIGDGFMVRQPSCFEDLRMSFENAYHRYTAHTLCGTARGMSPSFLVFFCSAKLVSSLLNWYERLTLTCGS